MGQIANRAMCRDILLLKEVCWQVFPTDDCHVGETALQQGPQSWIGLNDHGLGKLAAGDCRRGIHYHVADPLLTPQDDPALAERRTVPFGHRQIPTRLTATSL